MFKKNKKSKLINKGLVSIEWFRGTPNRIFVCSACNTGIINSEPPTWTYCPNCGAKIEGLINEINMKLPRNCGECKFKIFNVFNAPMCPSRWDSIEEYLKGENRPNWCPLEEFLEYDKVGDDK